MIRNERRGGSNVVKFPQKPQPEAVIDALTRDGTLIEYGDLRLMVMNRDLARTMDLMSKVPSVDALSVAESVILRVNALQPQLLAGKKMERAEYDMLYNDLMIWHCLKQMGALA